jgi:hypothetical protein
MFGVLVPQNLVLAMTALVTDVILVFMKVLVTDILVNVLYRADFNHGTGRGLHFTDHMQKTCSFYLLLRVNGKRIFKFYVDLNDFGDGIENRPVAKRA